jgi:hypothetical protein
MVVTEETTSSQIADQTANLEDVEGDATLITDHSEIDSGSLDDSKGKKPTKYANRWR